MKIYCKDKIPEIRIKDENKLIKGENIETYINSPFYPNTDNNIYNICKKCRENRYYFFCEECSKNICYTCSNKECQKKHYHKLIKFKPDEAKFYKNEIKRIIKEYFIEPKKKEENYEKEKQEIDENKIIDKSLKKFEKYTNDILLIKLIIHCNYNNFYHYNNIENSYK